jgi:hypothetical protein
MTSLKIPNPGETAQAVRDETIAKSFDSAAADTEIEMIFKA